MNKWTKAIMVVFMLMVLAAPVLSMAVTIPAPTNPASGPSNDPLDLLEIEELIRKIARFLIIVSLVIAVIFIVWGAITWMAAGTLGKDAAGAKTRIWNGIIGALIVLAVGVILQTLAALVARTFFNV